MASGLAQCTKKRQRVVLTSSRDWWIPGIKPSLDAWDMDVASIGSVRVLPLSDGQFWLLGGGKFMCCVCSSKCSTILHSNRQPRNQLQRFEYRRGHITRRCAGKNRQMLRMVLLPALVHCTDNRVQYLGIFMDRFIIKPKIYWPWVWACVKMVDFFGQISVDTVFFYHVREVHHLKVNGWQSRV